jgi:hypothetical protein
MLVLLLVVVLASRNARDQDGAGVLVAHQELEPFPPLRPRAVDGGDAEGDEPRARDGRPLP